MEVGNNLDLVKGLSVHLELDTKGRTGIDCRLEEKNLRSCFICFFWSWNLRYANITSDRNARAFKLGGCLSSSKVISTWSLRMITANLRISDERYLYYQKKNKKNLPINVIIRYTPTDSVKEVYDGVGQIQAHNFITFIGTFGRR